MQLVDIQLEKQIVAKITVISRDTKPSRADQLTSMGTKRREGRYRKPLPDLLKCKILNIINFT